MSLVGLSTPERLYTPNSSTTHRILPNNRNRQREELGLSSFPLGRTSSKREGRHLSVLIHGRAVNLLPLLLLFPTETPRPFPEKKKRRKENLSPGGRDKREDN